MSTIDEENGIEAIAVKAEKKELGIRPMNPKELKEVLKNVKDIAMHKEKGFFIVLMATEEKDGDREALAMTGKNKGHGVPRVVVIETLKSMIKGMLPPEPDKITDLVEGFNE